MRRSTSRTLVRYSSSFNLSVELTWRARLSARSFTRSRMLEYRRIDDANAIDCEVVIVNLRLNRPHGDGPYAIGIFHQRRPALEKFPGQHDLLGFRGIQP